MSGAAERVVRALDRHWFAPADLRDLAAVRIVLVGLFLGTMLAPELSGALGITGGYGFEAQRWFLEIPDESFAPIPMLKLLTVPFGAWGARPSPLLLHTIVWVALASGIMALVGVVGRTSMLVFAAATTLLIAHGYSYGELHHPQTLPVLALWVLPFAPIGGAWAVDALRGRIRRARRDLEFAPVRRVDRTHPFARWQIRTIQWLLVLAYLSAGLSKLEIGGLEWLNGYRILRHLAERAMTGSELAGFVGGLPLIATALAVVTVWFELTFAAAVVVPRLTLLYVITGTLLHVGIFVLVGAPFVGWPLLYVVLLENVRRGRSGAPRAGSPGAAARQAPRQADAPDAEVTPHADVAPDER
ncbi:MAG: hypothetical protein ACRELC_14055, partial [Gemmatimonadota bacterium]